MEKGEKARKGIESRCIYDVARRENTLAKSMAQAETASPGQRRRESQLLLFFNSGLFLYPFLCSLCLSVHMIYPCSLELSNFSAFLSLFSHSFSEPPCWRTLSVQFWLTPFSYPSICKPFHSLLLTLPLHITPLHNPVTLIVYLQVPSHAHSLCLNPSHTLANFLQVFWPTLNVLHSSSLCIFTLSLFTLSCSLANFLLPHQILNPFLFLLPCQARGRKRYRLIRQARELIRDRGNEEKAEAA